MSIMTGIVCIIGIIALASVLNNLIDSIWNNIVISEIKIEDKDLEQTDLIDELENFNNEEVER